MQENNTSRVFLVAAVVLGALAMVLAFVYLNQQDASRETPLKIVVAVHDLPPGKVVDPRTDLSVEEIPQKFKGLVARGILPEQLETFKNQKPNRRIFAGTPLLVSDFSTAADLELGAGLVGLSVQARGANALSGLLVPGDRVKVIVTRPVARTPAAGAPTGVPTWESVAVVDAPLRVLAVGSKLMRSRQQLSAADTSEASSGGDNQQTVTLEVTDAQAKAILEQSGAGQLPITLILVTPVGPAATMAK